MADEQPGNVGDLRMTREAKQLLSRVARLMAGQFQGELAAVRMMEQRSTVDEAADIARLTQRLQEVHDTWNALAHALEPDA